MRADAGCWALLRLAARPASPGLGSSRPQESDLPARNVVASDVAEAPQAGQILADPESHAVTPQARRGSDTRLNVDLGVLQPHPVHSVSIASRRSPVRSRHAPLHDRRRRVLTI